MLPIPIFWLLLLSICGYALWRGQRDERAAAIACLVASVATPLVVAPLRARFAGVETGVMLVDFVTLAVFIIIALQSSRFWPMWIAGLQLTTVMAHVLKAIELNLMPQSYSAAARFWSYPILIILAVGTWRSHRRARREQGVPTPA
jgi:hypothetical protein